jgi:hypothetical protein
VPWAFRPWRGKIHVTPAQLGLKFLRTLPKKLISRFRVLVLADTGFSSVEFVNGVEKLRDFQAIVGIPKSRLMANGKPIKTITKKGQQVQIQRFEKMVTASWFYLEQCWRRISGRQNPLKLASRCWLGHIDLLVLKD